MLSAIVLSTAAFLCSSAPDGTSKCDVVDTPKGKMCGPSVFLAGQTKAGSSSLWEWATKHPDFLPIQSEYLLPSKPRFRVARALCENFHEGNRSKIKMWIKSSNHTREEIFDPSVIPFDKNELNHAGYFSKVNLKELTCRIVMGKETRFFCPHIQDYLSALANGDTELMNSWFQDIFPSIPAFDDPSLPPEIRQNFGKITGEATPQYLQEWRTAPQLIRATYPSAKIIVLVREPVSKLRSMALFKRDQVLVDQNADVRRSIFHKRVQGFINHVEECMKQGHEMPDDPQFCIKHPLGKELRTAHPLKGIRKFLQHFPEKDRMKIMPSERLWKHPVEEMHILEDWLGLRRMDDAFWNQVTGIQYVPYMTQDSREFKTKEVIVADKPKKSSDDDINVPPRFNEIFREIFQAKNCELRELLGVDWSDQGYVYCDKPWPPAQKSAKSKEEL